MKRWLLAGGWVLGWAAIAAAQKESPAVPTATAAAPQAGTIDSLSDAAARGLAVGNKVIVADHALLWGGVAGDRVFPGLTLRTEAVRDGEAWVGQGKPGWLHERHLIGGQDAIAYFSAKAAAEPKKLQWPYARALVWFGRGEAQPAIDQLTALLKQRPNEVAFLNARGNAWQLLEKYPQALADYDRALQLAPSNAMVLNNRGVAWHRQHDEARAIADFNDGVWIDPKNAWLRNNRGHAWLAAGDVERALADHDEALRLDPKYALAHASRGRAWSVKQDYAKALADYRAALDLDPQLSAAANGLAWLRATCPDAKFRDGAEALAAAQRACEQTDFKDFGLLDTLAAAAAEQGDFAAAVKWQTQAVELAGLQHPEIQARLELYKQRKPYRETPSANGS